MEVTKIGETGAKIKGKTITLGINPFDGKGKNVVDVVLLLQREKAPELQVEDSPVVIQGPGEFEINGVKVTGIGKGEALAYVGKVDGIDIFITKTSSILQAKDILQECQIALIEADEVVDEAFAAKLNAHVVIVFGEHATETAKTFGTEAIASVKYTNTKDKLPQDLELILLQ